MMEQRKPLARRPVGKKVAMEYRNPGEKELKATTLEAVDHRCRSDFLPSLTESQAYKKAEEYLFLHFQNEFMKTEDFKNRFGDVAWEDISQDVMDCMDFERDRKAEKDLYQDKSYAFIGDILELEILIDRIVLDKVTGELQDIKILFW